MKPLFIAFEGIDGAGTTTQSRILLSRLINSGVRASLTGEPSGGPVGVLIRQILRKRVVSQTPSGETAQFSQEALALLFAADRLDHIHCEIKPLVASGVSVITDRYLLSSLAYQSLFCPPAWVKTINSLAPEPDITIFLEIPPEAAIKRIEATRQGRDIYENIETLREISSLYKRTVSDLKSDRIYTISGEKPRDEIADAVWEIVGAVS
ncbi:MAG: dTMP kinase [Deltaproteobacteria bacterium]|nr:dTMP kinase [Deltaproteobacteria bacterium]